MSTVAEKIFEDFLLVAGEHSHQNEWNIDAYLRSNSRLVGRAEFAGVYEWDEEGERQLVALKGWDVGVNPDFRRRGLASAMYAFAEEAFDLPIAQGDFQTPVGRVFLGGRKKSQRKS